MFKAVLVLTLSASIAVSGCAKRSSDVAAAYRSPHVYQGLTCPQLAAERRRVESRVAAVADKQDSAATRDAVAMGVGLVLFWPALFLLAAGDEKAELAQLKGEHEALVAAQGMKSCPELAPGAAAVAASAPTPDAPDESLPATPGLYEGAPLAAISAAEMRDYCAQSWETRVNAAGRTEFNPCKRPEAFSS